MNLLIASLTALIHLYSGIYNYCTSSRMNPGFASEPLAGPGSNLNNNRGTIISTFHILIYLIYFKV
jgi:hypothetical protein